MNFKPVRCRSCTVKARLRWPDGFASVLMNQNRRTTLENQPVLHSELSHQTNRLVGNVSDRVR